MERWPEGKAGGDHSAAAVVEGGLREGAGESAGGDDAVGVAEEAMATLMRRSWGGDGADFVRAY